MFPEGKKSGRPNASIRILVAMSVLKEGFVCSGEDLFEKCEFDLLKRKALGMELLTDVTPSIDTYYLFRRCICECQERQSRAPESDGESHGTTKPVGVTLNTKTLKPISYGS